EVLEEMEQAQARLAEIQALFAAASEEDFEDTEDSGVMASEEVKSKKDELKTANAEWKVELKTLKALAGNLFIEIQSSGLLPKGEKKGTYCAEGFTQKDPVFENGQRIIALATNAGHDSEYIAQIEEAITEGNLAYERTQSITKSLERHKVLEDEVKALKATIKGIEGKRDELVESARVKINNDEARIVIIERLRQVLMNTYKAYLRADQRACIKAIESLWSKYAVTAKTIESDRDEASVKLQAFMVELGYDEVQDAQVSQSQGCAGVNE
ncbi:MAG: restriction endonuclease subunit S, partial [Candidatus Thiodiazotropha sp. (ex Lucinoma kastoroae)]|nr:restriction endonuclease subunit S [Candidatus Thiodiazotropha sp. (ex Lucinoma kastoroae)]